MSFNSIEEYFAQFPDDIDKMNVSIQTHCLPDLSRFYKLTRLNCCNNQLTQLPSLPSTLIYLSCCYNELTQLPSLPSTLQYLDCNVNQLAQLPTLPSTLTVLRCIDNQLTQLPSLPYTLTMLHCGYNQLKQLPSLPSTLTDLVCYDNQLTQLPSLPSTLKYLVCYNNQLTQLPSLPSTLIHLDCRYILLPFDHEINHTNMTKYIIQMTNKNNIIIRFKELFYALKYKKKFRHLLWVHIREPKIRTKYHPDNLIKMLKDRENLTLDELDEFDSNW